MALVLEIVLGLMILAAFFVAFMSAKTWPAYQVVLVVMVFLAAVAFFYLSARTLATHTAWRNQVKQRETEVADAQRQTQELIDGGAPGPDGKPQKGIRQLRRELERLAGDRGGMMSDVAVGEIKDGVVPLTFKAPPGLPVGAVVFAFDQAGFAEGGRYLGEFTVTAVDENAPSLQVKLNLPSSEQATQRLAATKGPWVLYTAMPIDDAEVFAALDDATRQSMFPGSSVAEFAKADRPLHDFELFFHDSFLKRTLLVDAIKKISGNIELTEGAIKRANAEVAYRTSEKANLQADLEKFKVDQQAIAGYEQTLEAAFKSLRDVVQATFLENRQLAARYVEAQLEAAQAIDRRTSNPPPAATAPGRPAASAP